MPSSFHHCLVSLCICHSVSLSPAHFPLFSFSIAPLLPLILHTPSPTILCPSALPLFLTCDIWLPPHRITRPNKIHSNSALMAAKYLIGATSGQGLAESMHFTCMVANGWEVHRAFHGNFDLGILGIFGNIQCD